MWKEKYSSENAPTGSAVPNFQVLLQSHDPVLCPSRRMLIMLSPFEISVTHSARVRIGVVSSTAPSSAHWCDDLTFLVLVLPRLMAADFLEGRQALYGFA